MNSVHARFGDASTIMQFAEWMVFKQDTALRTVDVMQDLFDDARGCIARASTDRNPPWKRAGEFRDVLRFMD